MGGKRPRKSAFVPRLLVRTAIVGVVPACGAACGGGEVAPATEGGASGSASGSSSGSTTGSMGSSGSTLDAGPDSNWVAFGVASFAYDAGVADAAYGSRDADAAPAHADADAGLTSDGARAADAFAHWVLAVTAYEVVRPANKK